MAVRLRLKISVGDRSVEAVALLNSGYEASTAPVARAYRLSQGARLMAA